jgi:CubicO group peptidase (beta-lactamase class C family)
MPSPTLRGIAARSFRGASLTFLLAILPPAAWAQSPTLPFSGHFKGSISTPGSPLEIEVDLALAADGTGQGDISIPAQGARDLPLAAIAVHGPEITFQIAGVPGAPTFAGRLADGGKAIAGSFTQGGKSIPFELASAADPADIAKAALAGFDAFVEQAIAEWEVPGLALAVVRGDQVLLAKGYGFRDVEGKQPVTPETLFAIGSSTKAFTTFVLASLVDEGKLSWDKPVAAYLPGFALHDPHASAQITPRDLVTHRSGLPRHDALWYNNGQLSRKELVARLAFLDSNETLRARFQYNNLMFLTAGYLAESLTGKSWEDNVRERIWQPLGMTASTFSVADSQKSADFAYPYDKRDGKLTRIPFRDISTVGPAGSINSNLDDMARWVSVHLNGGKAGGKTILPAAALDELHAAQMVVGSPSPHPEISPAAYALGWFTDVYRGHPRVYHGGGIDGFSALVTLLPQDDLAIVVLTNRNGTGLPEQLTRHAADRLLSLPPIDWYGEATTRRKAAQGVEKDSEGKRDLFRKTGTRPSHPLADYAGDYEHPGYGTLKVAVSGNRLEMTYNGITTPLSHYHYEVFRAEASADPTFADTLFSFAGDPQGNVAAVSAPFEPAVPDAVFRKKPEARYFDPAYLGRLVGDYDLGALSIEISLSGDTLIAQPAGQASSPLEPMLGGEFVVARKRDAHLRFQEDAKGNVTGLYLLQDGVFEGKKKPKKG